MKNNAKKTWIQTGLLLSVGLALTFLYRGKWRLARIAVGFAVAFVGKWRDRRLENELDQLLTKAGKKT